jgi:beta-glucosidase
MKYTLLLALLIISGCTSTKAVENKASTKLESTANSINDNLKGFSPRVLALFKKMTLEEKIGQLNLLTPGGAVTGEVVSKDVNTKIKNGQVGGIFGIRGAAKTRQAQEIAVKSSRLGIPLIVGMDVIHGHQTILPIPLALSCTWDLVLIEASARQAAREATADGIMWNFSPMVDIARDPRWGRIAEGSGEDPFLGAAISAAMVRGYQGKDLKDPTTMMACVKHFANYGAAEGGRDYATVDMSKLRSYNEYLPPYKAAIDAGVGSVMTSFNVMEYLPASAHKELMTDVLRKQWGFDGFVVTDYTSINEMIAHGIGDLQQVSAEALKAGVDMDMVGEGFLTTLKKSLDDGKITQNDIDIACLRILRAKEQLGLLDDPFLYFDEARAAKELFSAENRAFSRKAAAESFVLLKNDKDILPLNEKTKIALVGPLADSRRNMNGTWSVSGDHEKSVTVIEGIKNLLGSTVNVKYAKGANISDDKDFAKRVNAFGPEIVIDDRSAQAMIDEALAIAIESDVIVAVMGEAADMTGEASSMVNIELQPSQRKLLLALKALGKPIVMVLYNGRPMVLKWENDNLDAILDVWFGGTEGGNAVADVLFGKVNPGGRLTTSFPEHVGQVPVYHSMLNTGRPDLNSRGKFRSNYLDATNDPVFPFGFGLSYSKVAYAKAMISDTTLVSNKEISVSIEITNTGLREAKETIQMYIRDVVGSISRPMKELKGFQKVTLKPGASQVITFKINEELLKFYNSKLEHVAEKGEFEVMIGRNSVDTQTLKFTLR